MTDFTQKELTDLNFLELNTMLEHIRSGENHLRNHLNAQQFNELMSLGSLKRKQHKNVKTDTIEKSSNVANALNGALTGLYGSWLGLSGFAGISLGSIKLLILYTSIATVTGVLIGYFGYNSVKKQAKTSIIKQKLRNIEIKLINIINQKREEDKQKLIKDIKELWTTINPDEVKAVSALQDQKNLFETKNLSNWLNQLSQMIAQRIVALSNDDLHQLFANDIKQCLTGLKATLSKNIEIQSVNKEKSANDYWEIKPPNKEASLIKKLIQPKINIKSPAKKPSWLRRNLSNIAAGFFPTLFGTFGSMFVFLTAPPNLAKEFGKHKLYAVLTNPTVKLISFTLALIVTIYFAISFLYNNRKAYKRDHELEKAEKKLAESNNKMMEFNAQINILEKIKIDLQRINHLLGVIYKIDTYLKQNNDND